MNKVTKKQIDNFLNFTNKYSDFVIVGHKEPDGDCISSCLGMQELLRQLGKKTTLISSGPFKRTETKKYESKFVNTLNYVPQNSDSTGLFILDCSELKRVGDIEEKINNLDYFIIDHHKTSDAEESKSIIDSSSPAAVYLVMQLFEALNIEITKNTASTLFFGLSTDTGFFRFLNDTQHEVFEAAARLVKKGANPRKTYDEMTGGKPFSTRKMLSILLNNAKQYFDGKLIITYETQEDTKTFGQNGRDVDSLYQLMLSTEGVEAVVCIKQETEQQCTVGFRSRDEIDVSAVAQVFGGGGHKNAAGLSVTDTIESLIPKLLKEFEKYL